MASWYMLSVVGKDKSGIVARISEALFAAGANLGEASMTRLGDSFTMMFMVSYSGSLEALERVIQPAIASLNLRAHIDPIEGGLHRHVAPNIAVRVFGADRAGIVAQVSEVLADLGVSITSLETEVAGTQTQPLYIMLIEAYSECDFSQLQAKIKPLNDAGYEIKLSELDLMLG